MQTCGLNIVVEGCAHGALEEIYDAIVCLENVKGVKVDLLLCCGDFQSLRNEDDYESLACPPKYRSMVRRSAACSGTVAPHLALPRARILSTSTTLVKRRPQ
jgi:hypothetical protein